MADVQALSASTVLVTGCGLLRSDDGGLRLRALPIPGQSAGHGLRASSFSSPEVGYVLRSDGQVLITGMGARASRRMVFSPPPAPSAGAPPTSMVGLVLYTANMHGSRGSDATSKSYVYRTSDGGRTWSPVLQTSDLLTAVDFGDPAHGVYAERSLV